MRRASALVMTAVMTALVGVALPAGASHAPATAISYINPDVGAPTANPNVAPNSDCDAPDREDTQQLSDAGTANRNVHNDACLRDENNAEFSGPVTFESTGVGFISACPDPDMTTAANGPGIAFTHDHNGDTFADHCHQTAFQTKGAAGDNEYHARLNNTSTAGDQTVVFCYDPELGAAGTGTQPAGHGCADAATGLKDLIVIHWQSTAPEPTTAISYLNPDTGAATANPTVDADSDCDSPDREDTQVLSDTGMTNRNVHNDACLRDQAGDDFNGSATFESTGVGFISACPDPDAVTDSTGAVTSNGPGMAYTHDHNGDMLADHCHQTGFQAKNAAGDGEYHARLNNTTTPGDQTVVFCYDPQQDQAAAPTSQPAGHGCSDTQVKDTVVVHWLSGDPVTAGSNVSIRRDRPNFTGNVASTREDCEEGRTVTLRRARRGPDRTIRSTTTDDQGSWSIHKRRARGRFYVKVARSSFTTGDGIEVTCSATRSNTIRTRR